MRGKILLFIVTLAIPWIFAALEVDNSSEGRGLEVIKPAFSFLQNLGLLSYSPDT